MRLLFRGLLAGLALGGLSGAGIYLASEMPLTPRIIYAELILGAILGTLMTRVVRVGAGWVRTLVGGAILGFLLAAILASEAEMVPYILEAGVAQGVALAAVLKKLCPSTQAGRA